MKINTIEKMLPYLIIIDYLTGLFFFRFNLTLPFSQIAKLLFVCLILAILAIKRTDLFIIFTIAFCVFSLSSFKICIEETTYKLILDLLYYLKIFIFPLSYMGFLTIKKNRKNTDISKSNFLFIFLFFAIGLTVFGFGEYTYSYGVGFMGYFIAGNEVSGLLLLVFSIFLFDKYMKRVSTLKFLIFSFLTIATGLMVMTKTAIIGSIFIPILMVIIIFYFNQNSLRIKKNILRKIIFFVFIIVFFIIFIFVNNITQNYIDKISISIKDVGGIKNFIFSGRNFRLEDSLRLFKSSNLFNFLFGFGFENSKNILKAYNVWGCVEIDFFDILITNGIIGVVIIYSFWIMLLLRSIKQVLFKQNILAIPITISIILLFFNTFIAGHIVNSALLGVFLGYYTSLINK